MTSSFAIDHPPAANDAGVRRGKPWTEEEDAALLSKASAYGIGGAAVHMGRTAKSGYHRYLKLQSVHLTKGE